MKTPKKIKIQGDKVFVEPTVLAEDLHDYIRDRAKGEGVAFSLSKGFFGAALAHKASPIFGVRIKNGRMVEDNQEPSPGYFAKWVEERSKRAHDARVAADLDLIVPLLDAPGLTEAERRLLERCDARLDVNLFLTPEMRAEAEAIARRVGRKS